MNAVKEMFFLAQGTKIYGSAFRYMIKVKKKSSSLHIYSVYSSSMLNKKKPVDDYQDTHDCTVTGPLMVAL